MATTNSSSRALKITAGVAILFGALSVFSGGRVLFGSDEARAAVGDAVLFVLWFNFLAGFAYIVAGIGLFLQHRPAIWVSFGILAATTLAFLAFGNHVLQGGAYEMRTVGAMILRIGIWAIISVVAWRHIGQTPRP
ncbi:hypothetical protein [Pararhizobium sp. IMCC21322]|uniref:hypothetical protein n=1 Tax=Pararhizobium sp. IMCC21322 TaxID=3067903 RepID=UPI002741F98B|nr:hypothetical protein [Pararhizobium sp. IMCC21322]